MNGAREFSPKENHENKKWNLLTKVGLVIAFIFLVFSINFFFTPVETKTFGMSLTVSTIIGFNNRNDSLYFGQVMPGGVSTRTIIARNDLYAPQLVKFSVSGNIAEFISTSDNNFLALGKDERQIKVSASVPAYLNGAEKKTYTGTLLITMKRLY